MKMYIAVLDEVADNMVPVLVAHSVLNAHLGMSPNEKYNEWLSTSFRKVVLKVNRKEFDKISKLETYVWLGHENKTLDGQKTCAVVLPMKSDEVPNVLKFARMWKPN